MDDQPTPGAAVSGTTILVPLTDTQQNVNSQTITEAHVAPSFEMTIEALTESGSKKTSLHLGVGAHVIGRDEYCDVRLNEDFVSSIHALLIIQPHGGMILMDLGSANGTFIDERLLPAVKRTLRQNEQFRITNSRYKLTVVQVQ